MAAEDYFDLDRMNDQQFLDENADQDIDWDKYNRDNQRIKREIKKMAKKVNKKPLLVKAGNHLIDPNDVACITRVKTKGLYIVRLKSQPNMEYPIWIQKNQIEALLEHFEIQLSDIPEEGE